MMSVLGFLLILGPLVVFHEFGHYFFARLFNVKAEVFSIGFGPRIWARKVGETEWRVSAIPLGGYVRLLGEDRAAELPPAEEARALHRQAPWKRFWIFFGGPLFNFILSVFIFMVILVIGEPQVSSVVSRVVEHSAAEKVGFLSGDRILEVSGKPVTKFEEVLVAVGDQPGHPVDFAVSRGASRLKITATPTAQDGFSVYGEATHLGEIDGLLPAARQTVIGVSDPRSVVGAAGFRTGDRVREVNGQPVASWEDLERIYGAAAPGTAFTLRIQRSTLKEAVAEAANSREIKPKPLAAIGEATGETRTLSLVKPADGRGMGAAWGLWSSELLVEQTIAKSPAEQSGLQVADRLIGVGDENVHSFYELRDAVQRSGEKDGKVRLRWERGGKVMEATITPNATTTRDPTLKKTTQYTVGVVPMLALVEPPMVLERVLNPFLLVFEATKRMVDFSVRNFVSVRKMLTGDVSVGTLGGPIMIGKIAGESIARGLIAFLTTMSILSVGLGVLNILPVPILDGGHILLLLVECVRGRPLTLRQMEVIQGAGLFMILLLMGVVIRNDITRLPIFD